MHVEQLSLIHFVFFSFFFFPLQKGIKNSISLCLFIMQGLVDGITLVYLFLPCRKIQHLGLCGKASVAGRDCSGITLLQKIRYKKLDIYMEEVEEVGFLKNLVY